MKICPRCNREFERLLALSRKDNKTMICDQCGTEEALDDAGMLEGNKVRGQIVACVGRGNTPQERARAAVYTTGNKWAIENFEATHG